MTDAWKALATLNETVGERDQLRHEVGFLRSSLQDVLNRLIARAQAEGFNEPTLHKLRDDIDTIIQDSQIRVPK